MNNLNKMGAEQNSVEMKLKKEKYYLEKLKEEYKAINTKSSYSTNATSMSYYKKSFSNKKVAKTKKYNLNILYYDEHLKIDEENSDNCSFIEMNTNGTFYGCHNFELFKIVCDKLKKSGKEFILLSSGSCAEKIFQYCSNMNQIREYYIYCFLKEKYMPLMDKYSKLKGVYNIFSILKEKLYTIKEIEMNYINSSNLIYNLL